MVHLLYHTVLDSIDPSHPHCPVSAVIDGNYGTLPRQAAAVGDVSVRVVVIVITVYEEVVKGGGAGFRAGKLERAEEERRDKLEIYWLVLRDSPILTSGRADFESPQVSVSLP